MDQPSSIEEIRKEFENLIQCITLIYLSLASNTDITQMVQTQIEQGRLDLEILKTAQNFIVESLRASDFEILETTKPELIEKDKLGENREASSFFVKCQRLELQFGLKAFMTFPDRKIELSCYRFNFTPMEGPGEVIEYDATQLEKIYKETLENPSSVLEIVEQMVEKVKTFRQKIYLQEKWERERVKKIYERTLFKLSKEDYNLQILSESIDYEKAVSIDYKNTVYKEKTKAVISLKNKNSAIFDIYMGFDSEANYFTACLVCKNASNEVKDMHNYYFNPETMSHSENEEIENFLKAILKIIQRQLAD